MSCSVLNFRLHFISDFRVWNTFCWQMHQLHCESALHRWLRTLSHLSVTTSLTVTGASKSSTLPTTRDPTSTTQTVSSTWKVGYFNLVFNHFHIKCLFSLDICSNVLNSFYIFRNFWKGVERVGGVKARVSQPLFLIQRPNIVYASQGCTARVK